MTRSQRLRCLNHQLRHRFYATFGNYLFISLFGDICIYIRFVFEWAIASIIRFAGLNKRIGWFQSFLHSWSGFPCQRWSNYMAVLHYTIENRIYSMQISMIWAWLMIGCEFCGKGHSVELYFWCIWRNIFSLFHKLCINLQK